MHDDAVLRLLCGTLPVLLGKKTFGGRSSGQYLGDVTESSMSG